MHWLKYLSKEELSLLHLFIQSLSNNLTIFSFFVL